MTTTLYYDPILDIHHRVPVTAALTTAFYAAPQFPDDAQRLFRAGCAALGVPGPRDAPIPAGRAFGSSLVLAREWGLADVEEWLVDAIEDSYEPTWNDARTEFTWGLGLDERYPRGQFNAFLAAAEAAGPGRWARVSGEPVPPMPQVVDVDFPTLALRRAEWIDGELHVGLAPAREDPRTTTSFRVVGAEPRQWDVVAPDGTTIEQTASGLNVRVPLVHADMTLTPGSY